MARINVDAYAFDDPRFEVLAGSLRCLRDRWHALGRCLRIWHLCASRRTDTVRPVELAQCLGVRKPLTASAQELATKAFVDTAGLGEWQGDVIRVRGTKGRTDYLDRMEQAKSLPERVLDHVREHGLCKRSKLRQHFADAPRSTFYRVVNQLVADGELVATGDTLSIPLAESVPRESHENLETVPGQSRDAVPTLAPVPALAPIPALALAERASSARAHTCPTQVSPASPTDVSRESHGTSAGETIPLAQAALAATRPDRFSSLFKQWDTIGREHCGKSWRSPGELAGRHRIREALNHPELAGRTDDDIRHGLAMLRTECDQRALLGEKDAWCWYRQAWTPRVLSAACDIPDEATARDRASPRSNRTAKTMTWMDEAKAEIEAKERARANY